MSEVEVFFFTEVDVEAEFVKGELGVYDASNSEEYDPTDVWLSEEETLRLYETMKRYYEGDVNVGKNWTEAH